CNGGPEGKLADPAVIQARTIQENLKGPSAEHLSLPAGRESIFSYFVRDENGSVSFHDDSPGQPKVLRELQAFVLATAQNVCHLPQQRARRASVGADRLHGARRRPARS